MRDTNYVYGVGGGSVGGSNGFLVYKSVTDLNLITAADKTILQTMYNKGTIAVVENTTTETLWRWQITSGTTWGWVQVTYMSRGATGPQGKSAYEVAKDNGYTGTETQWLASLDSCVGKYASLTALETVYPDGYSANKFAIIVDSTSQAFIVFYENGDFVATVLGSGSSSTLSADALDDKSVELNTDKKIQFKGFASATTNSVVIKGADTNVSYKSIQGSANGTITNIASSDYVNEIVANGIVLQGIEYDPIANTPDLTTINTNGKAYSWIVAQDDTNVTIGTKNFPTLKKRDWIVKTASGDYLRIDNTSLNITWGSINGTIQDQSDLISLISQYAKINDLGLTTSTIETYSIKKILELIDKHRKVFIQSTIPSSPTSGDLWVNNTTSTSYSLSAYNGTSWVGIGGGSGSGIKVWKASTAYVVGDIVLDDTNNKLYKCTTAHTSSTTITTSNFKLIGGTGISDWVATTGVYSVGDYVRYDNCLYVCKTAHTAAATFDLSKWDKINDTDLKIMDTTKRKTYVADINNISLKFIYDSTLSEMLVYNGKVCYSYSGRLEGDTFPTSPTDGNEYQSAITRIKYTYSDTNKYWKASILATDSTKGMLSASDKVKLDNTIANVKNHTDVINPSATDNLSNGYTIGSIWYNSATSTTFICVDSSDSLGMWVNKTADFYYFDTWDELVTAISATGTTYVNKFCQVLYANGGPSSKEVLTAPATVANPIVDGLSAIYKVSAQGTNYSVTCMERNIVNPVVTSILSASETIPTASGYYIFLSTYTKTLPTGIEYNDIAKYDGVAWTAFQTYVNASPIILVGKTLVSEISYIKEAGTWKKASGGFTVKAENADFIADVQTSYLCDVSSNTIKVTLPATTTLNIGDSFEIHGVKGDCSTHPITIDFITPNQMVESLTGNNFVMDKTSSFKFYWTGDTIVGWKILPINLNGAIILSDEGQTKNANFSASCGISYICDVSSNAIAVTPPPLLTLRLGDSFDIHGVKGDFSTNKLTIDFGASNEKVENTTGSTFTMDKSSSFRFYWTGDAIVGWKILPIDMNGISMGVDRFVDWTSYTPTLGVATGTSPTIGANDSYCLYQVDKNTLRLKVNLNSYVTASGSGDYIINLPSGYNINTDLMPVATSLLGVQGNEIFGIQGVPVGTGIINSATSGNTNNANMSGSMTLRVASDTSLIMVANSPTNVQKVVGDQWYGTANQELSISFTAEIAIL